MRDPFFIDEPTSISFSGGRTSAYMLWRVLQAHGGKLPPEAIVLFANTGKEMEETLRFVQRCSDEWQVPITWLEFHYGPTPELRFKVTDFQSASRSGEPFESVIFDLRANGYLPNPIARFCTVELKVRTIHRYLKSIGWTEWTSMIGIRADEQRRLAKIGNQDYGKHEEKYAPLGVAGVTKQTVGEFWKAQPFDLELPNINGVTYHGNCDLCFLKPASQVFSLIRENPQRAVWWAAMENKCQSSGLTVGDGARFRKDRPSYQQMIDYASKQDDLFADDEPSIECFCGD